jgi:hypothetical protein
VALRLLCARPLFRNLDLPSARFVVSKATGLDVNGRHLNMGEEVPPGALNPYALQCEYERPLARIDLLEYAMTIDGLREACESYGGKQQKPELKQVIKPEEPQAEEPKAAKPDLDALGREELIRLCDLGQLDTTGTVKQLRQRLEEFLA